MTQLNEVLVTGTLPGAAGAEVIFTPSGWLTDAGDGLMVPPSPQPVTIADDGTFSVPLVATDNAGMTPGGWSWSVTITGIEGVQPYSFSFLLPYANGATQDITTLVPVEPVTEMAAYLPLSGGTMGGPLTLAADPVTGLQAATKQYVDAHGGSGGGAVASVNGHTGTVVLAASDVGAASTAALASEVTRAGTAETANATAIAAETSRAQGAETANAAAIAAETSRAETAEAALVPQAQTFALANNTYRDLLKWQVTGQTDTVQPFGLKAGSQTYGTSTPIQGPACWLGYNPDLLSGSVASSAHGAVGISCFGDAGDTNNGAGGHGLELNPACFRTADGTKGTNAIQMVAVDDDTNTVGLTLCCGTGTSGSIRSQITLANADGSFKFASMDGSTGAIAFFQNHTTTVTGADALSGLGSVSGNAFYYVNAASGKAAGFQFQVAGAPKSSFVYDDSEGAFYILGPDGTIPIFATASLVTAVVPWDFSSGLAVPSASATPSGTPAEGVGAIRVYGTAIWVYTASGWKSVALS